MEFSEELTMLQEDYQTSEYNLSCCEKENELLNMLLNSPYDGIVFVDIQGIIQYVNDSFANYNKVSKHVLIGRKYEDFPFDNNLLRILKLEVYEPFSFFTTDRSKKMIASRRPVYNNGKLVGVFGRYLSVDPRDIKKYFGENYIDIIGRLQARDIMFNINQAIIEFNSFKDQYGNEGIGRMGINNIVGSNPVIEDLKKKILVVSESPSSVLLTGESGTGKELFAKAIHSHGNRSQHPLVKINCAAIPENLLEAELFGYVDGAFTGARKGGKPGKFELANKGSLFLDEIGDMPLAMQSKLLRVLQERELERIGSADTIPIDVRIISATNKNLPAMINEGSFREDLYYRLNVVNLHIPPLRERKTDIPEILSYLLHELNGKLGRSILKISPEAMHLFLSYNWPGNVRELVNVLEGAMNFCRSSIIEPEDLPFFLHSCSEAKIVSEAESLQTKLDYAEKEQLISVLKQCKGNRKETAAILELSKTTLYRLMKKHNLL